RAVDAAAAERGQPGDVLRDRGTIERRLGRGHGGRRVRADLQRLAVDGAAERSGAGEPERGCSSQHRTDIASAFARAHRILPDSGQCKFAEYGTPDDPDITIEDDE